jgi:mono/diheme cytochrome c family protein
MLVLADRYLQQEYYRSHSPDQVFSDLRLDQDYALASDAEIWSLVARIWEANTNQDELIEGKQLFAENCAACHGETGGGDGVFAEAINTQFGKPMTDMGHGSGLTSDFTDPHNMLGASPGLLQGKILRGGMGTGMPSWGSIFTDQQTWNLVAYLYTFQFEYMEFEK